MNVSVYAVGLCGPGLRDWSQAAAILAGHEQYRGGAGRVVLPHLDDTRLLVEAAPC